MPRNGEATRVKILQAANRLFYGLGVRAVSIDAIAAKAGITKKSLYYHFRSKDDLVTAYLVSRDQPNVDQFRTWFDEADGDLKDKTRSIFTKLADVCSRNRRWRGCGFLRTAAELVDTPGHPAVKAASAHKKRVEAWLAGAFADGGRPDADDLARQVVLLMDGAFSAMLVHRDVAYVHAAGAAAAKLIGAAEDGKGEDLASRPPMVDETLIRDD